MSGKLPAELVDRARQADLLVTAQNLGARLRRINAAEHVGPCPACGGTDRFSVNTRKQAWNCRGGGGGRDAISLVIHVRGGDFREAVGWLAGEDTAPAPARPAPPAPPKPAGDDEARSLRSAARIVADLGAIKGTPGEQYLRQIRKIDTNAIADVLKRTDAVGWHPAIYFNEPEYPERGDPPHPLHGRKLGAIVAIMSDPFTAAPTGAISRSYLGPDGTKVLKAKTFGSPAGIIRLTPDDDVLGGLHFAEGLETALDAMSKGFRPIWAAGSTPIMARFPVLAGIECLTVFADNDANGAGQRAASEAASRWLAAGREVRVYQRETTGDLNDAFREVKR
jgi:putative DNA primase/helicase